MPGRALLAAFYFPSFHMDDPCVHTYFYGERNALFSARPPFHHHICSELVTMTSPHICTGVNGMQFPMVCYNVNV